MTKSGLGALALTLAFVALGLTILPRYVIAVKEDRETLQDKFEDAADTLIAELEGKPKTDPLRVFGLAATSTALLGLILGVAALVRKENMGIAIAAVVINCVTLILHMA